MANANVGGGDYTTPSGKRGLFLSFAGIKVMVFNAAVQAGYLQYRLDWNKLVLATRSM
jgi:hypothetical protein